MSVTGRALLCVAVLMFASPPAMHGQSREEVGLWQTVQNSTNPDDLRAYLDKYPEGTFAALAKRRLATLLEAKRATVGGSNWDGREYFTKARFTGRINAAMPNDPKAQYLVVSVSFAANGTCIVYGNRPCTWKQIGESITIEVPSAKGEPCREDFALRMGKQGTQMSGNVAIKQSGSCLGNSAYVTLSRTS